MSLEFAIDREATKSAGFKDRRSWVTNDGRLWLYGKDKSNTRAEVFERDGNACVECGSTYWLEDSHDVRKSELHDDRIENRHVRCRPCHIKKDGHGQPMHF